MTPRASVTGSADCWRGAIRIGNRVIWRCDHIHGNRNHATKASSAASPCASEALKIALASDEDIARIDAYFSAPRDPRFAHLIESGRRRHEYAKSQRDIIRAALTQNPL